jgi:hypothetical protein
MIAGGEKCMSHPDFELFNPIQPGQKKSRLQHLTDILAFQEDWALEAVEHLEGVDAPHVAIFFQLPKPVFVEGVPYRMPANREGTDIEFHFKPFLFNVTPGGNVAIQTPPAETRANATQTIAYVPLWGKWAEVYERYARCFTGSGLRDEIVWSNKEYWEGRTLRAKDFEIELSSRLVREIDHALRRFLKSYSTIVRAQHADTNWLYGAFMMPYPGRISQFRESTPLLTHFLNETASSAPATIDAARIHRGVEFTYRKFSRFETQIFELNRLVSSGSYALALAGSLSLVEWVLKLSAPKEAKQLTLGELTEYFSARGLADDRQFLDALRRLRNKATHLGEEADRGEMRPHEILSIDIDQAINEQTARQAIDLAWRVFQKANSGIFRR